MRVILAILLLASAAAVQATQWVAVSQISNNVREVDKDSIQGNGPQKTFTSRHVVAEAGEYRIGRQAVKYLVMEQRIDCAKRTILVLASEARNAEDKTITRQVLSAQLENAILPGSVDEDVYIYVCGTTS